MPPKRQHYVPRLHLKHFVGTKPKGQIWTYDKETGEKRSGKPENTAVETHFYSVENDDGTMDTWLEDCLAKVEDKAGPIYKHLVAGHLPTSDQEKADFSTFVALMYLRTPAVRRDAAEIIGREIQIMSYAYGSDDRAFADLVERFEREGRTLDDAAKHRLREVLIDPSHYTLKIPKARTFMALGAADKLAPLLFGMNWSLVRPKHGFFITSDHPVMRWVDPKTRHPFYGDHGFLDKTVEVTFPLAPKMLLMMAWQTMRKTAELRRDSVWSTNKMRASRADRYIYAHIGSKELRQLAVSFKGSRPELTTEGFGPKRFAKVKVERRRSKPRKG